jgi:DNA-binding NtrC family response regulator
MSADINSSPGILAGKHVLLVEDETAISFLIEDMLHELGAQKVTYAASVKSARELLDAAAPCMAVLDVNVAGDPVYPIAEELLKRGVPFVFLTGYGRDGVSERWSSHHVVQKPVDIEGLEHGLAALLASARA